MEKKVKSYEERPGGLVGGSGRKTARWSTKISVKHQVTIPVSAFEAAGLAVGDRLKAKPIGTGKVLLERVESAVDTYAGVLTGVWERDELERLRNEWD